MKRQDALQNQRSEFNDENGEVEETKERPLLEAIYLIFNFLRWRNTLLFAD